MDDIQGSAPNARNTTNPNQAPIQADQPFGQPAVSPAAQAAPYSGQQGAYRQQGGMPAMAPTYYYAQHAPAAPAGAYQQPMAPQSYGAPYPVAYAQPQPYYVDYAQQPVVAGYAQAQQPYAGAYAQSAAAYTNPYAVQQPQPYAQPAPMPQAAQPMNPPAQYQAVPAQMPAVQEQFPAYAQGVPAESVPQPYVQGAPGEAAQQPQESSADEAALQPQGQGASAAEAPADGLLPRPAAADVSPSVVERAMQPQVDLPLATSESLERPQADPIEPAESAAPAEPEYSLSSFFPASRTSDEAVLADADDEEAPEPDETARSYMQNRELSWLTFDERVLDQGADESVPLLERLNFISIFWSNLQEFFMVRVGSLTDLSYIEPPVKDSKTGMTPKEQIKAIHERCRELYPIQESYYEHVRGSLAKEGVRHLRPDDLSDEQRNYLTGMVKYNIEPFLSPQIINPRHPFPHLENGKLYILVRLDDEAGDAPEKKKKKGKKAKKNKGGAEGVVLGLIPLPHQCERVIKLPGRGFQFILLEHAIEMYAAEIFSMYTIKHTNVICVTRNADIDANQTGDEQDEDYREHMKRLLKQRARLAPVRLECERPLSPVMEKHMLKKLGLKRSQVYDTTVPLDLSFTWGLGSRLSDRKREKLSNPPFTPAWPAAFDRKRRIIDQVGEGEFLLSYPYESMDPFVQLLKEAAFDPSVVSIKITLYRLASQSQLAEALITAAENGKNVTALFELRARFDESNNIEWSQRFEQAGCNVIYGFRDYKVHSKICCITRQLADGSLQHITQLGTGNYNEKTAKLYTDLSFITTDEAFGHDATEFFRNMQLENVSDNYEVLRVAPLQIKPMILENLDRQIALARAGKPCGAFLKANSVTDKDVIEKIAEASQAGVGVTLFVRGICCLVPEVKGLTDNVRVVSIVGRLLEHSRIYCFGTPDDCTMYLSSADLMTRNLNKRVEIAWPILSADIRRQILSYIDTCLHDTAKLRELRPNLSYTPLGAFCELDEEGNTLPPFDAQAALIERAAERSEEARRHDEEARARMADLPQTLEGDEAAQIAVTFAHPSEQPPSLEAQQPQGYEPADDQWREEPVPEDTELQEPAPGQPEPEEPVSDEPVFDEPAVDEPSEEDLSSADSALQEEAETEQADFAGQEELAQPEFAQEGDSCQGDGSEESAQAEEPEENSQVEWDEGPATDELPDEPQQGEPEALGLIEDQELPEDQDGSEAQDEPEEQGQPEGEALPEDQALPVAQAEPEEFEQPEEQVPQEIPGQLWQKAVEPSDDEAVSLTEMTIEDLLGAPFEPLPEASQLLDDAPSASAQVQIPTPSDIAEAVLAEGGSIEMPGQQDQTGEESGTDFFDGKSRDLEMPPQKKGLLSRFF